MSNQIAVEIVNISKEMRPTKTGKTFVMYDIAYKNRSFNNKLEGKKQADFVAKNVAAVLEQAANGDVFTVTREKDGDYWKWVNMESGDNAGNNNSGASNNMAAVTATPSKSPKSTYETPEERARRQVLIVRQSSIANAIEMLKVDKKAVGLEDVIPIAEAIESWVMRSDEAPAAAGGTFDDLDDDVPL